MFIHKLSEKKHILASLLILAGFTNVTSYAKVPGITTGEQLQAAAEKRTKVISTAELKKALDEHLDMVLVDVRMPSEITAMGGAIKAQQNINIPRGWLEYRISRVALSKDTPIVVYCGAGIRTPLAADTLQKMGYTNVRNYSAGYIGWKKAGLPTAK